jgi:small-conductance mechanosensitive channel
VLDVDEWRSAPIFSNSLTHWLLAGLIAAVVFGVLITLRIAVRRYAHRLRATRQQEFLEIPMRVLSRTTQPFFLVVAIYFGLRVLTVGDKVQALVNSAATIAFFWQAGVWVVAAIRAFIDRRRQIHADEDRAIIGSLGIISFIASMVVWTLVLLLTLDNLGVNITALVAGLGIGGVAVALALQNVLGDLFASLSIALDRPFVVGDFLAVDNFLGSVENIGIKTTRLRSLDGEQIIMSNGDLLKSRVRNYGRMAERRVQFSLAVAYGTPLEEIERIPGWIREFIVSEKDTRFDRSHFLKHGPASLEFETVYFVTTADFNRYMDIQQSINLKIHRRFAEQHIDFAVPTQKLVLSRRKDLDEVAAEQPSAAANQEASEEPARKRRPGRAS